MWRRFRRWLARKLWPDPVLPTANILQAPWVGTGTRYMIVEHHGHADQILCQTDDPTAARHYWEVYHPRVGAVTEFRDGALCRDVRRG